MIRRYPVINLGQGPSRAEQLIADYNRAIARLEDLAKQLPEGPKMVVLRKTLECKENNEDIRDIPEAYFSSAITIMDKCIADAKNMIDSEIAKLQTPGAPPSTLAPVSSGSSNLLYAAGAAAAIGAGVLLLV